MYDVDFSERFIQHAAGKAYIHITDVYWQLLDGNPMADDGSRARLVTDAIRKRAAISEEYPRVDEYVCVLK